MGGPEANCAAKFRYASSPTPFEGVARYSKTVQLPGGMVLETDDGYVAWPTTMTQRSFSARLRPGTRAHHTKARASRAEQHRNGFPATARGLHRCLPVQADSRSGRPSGTCFAAAHRAALFQPANREHRSLCPRRRRDDSVRRIAVIGASGFVGSTLVEQLLMGTDEVVPFIHSSGNAWRIARLGIELRALDLLDGRQVEAALHGVTHVVNCSRGGDGCHAYGSSKNC